LRDDKIYKTTLSSFWSLWQDIQGCNLSTTRDSTLRDILEEYRAT
jgi:hypothetical protein